MTQVLRPAGRLAGSMRGRLTAALALTALCGIVAAAQQSAPPPGQAQAPPPTFRVEVDQPAASRDVQIRIR